MTSIDHATMLCAGMWRNGATRAEIARAFGRSVSWVDVRLTRALATMSGDERAAYDVDRGRAAPLHAALQSANQYLASPSGRDGRTLAALRAKGLSVQAAGEALGFGPRKKNAIVGMLWRVRRALQARAFARAALLGQSLSDQAAPQEPGAQARRAPWNPAADPKPAWLRVGEATHV